VKIPRPLRDRKLLAFIDALDEQFANLGNPGSFTVEFHYGPGGEPKKAKLVAPTLEFPLRKDLTPAESGAEDAAQG
jgi:hypothetical protein